MRHDWLAGAYRTLRALADAYGQPYGPLCARARREKWGAQRADVEREEQARRFARLLDDARARASRSARAALQVMNRRGAAPESVAARARAAARAFADAATFAAWLAGSPP